MKPVLDISNWQKGITHVDWVGIRQHFSMVGIKATEGVHTNDKSYSFHAAEASSVHLPFTPYHFAHPEFNDPSEEVNHFLAIVHKPSPLIPTLDIEISAGRKDIDLWVHEFCMQVRKEVKVTPMVYTFSGFLWHFKKPRGNGLWIANYNRNDGKLHPIGSPNPWKSFRLHQYTSRGRTPYVEGYVDLSVFRSGATLNSMIWEAKGV